MWPVSADWLAALGHSHGRYTRMEVWYAGEQVAEYQPQSGSVQVTARNRIRRMLTAVLPESAYPTNLTDPLAPYGSQLRVYQGITGANGSLVGAEVPVFAGRVKTVQRQRLSGTMTVTAEDRFAEVNDLEFEVPYTGSGGVVASIVSLVTDAVPGVMVVDKTGSPASVPAGMTWPQDRGQAIDDLAAAIGAEVYFTPDGATCVIRPVPTLGAAPVWTLTEGVGGTLIRDSDSRDRTDIANRLVVHVEQPGQTPILVYVTDTDGNSPTRYGGPYGKVIRHYSNPLISRPDQAYAAGVARLARVVGATRVRQLDHVPNPALEAGDPIAVQTAAGTGRHIADSFALPLAVADVMTTQTRSTGTSIS